MLPTLPETTLPFNLVLCTVVHCNAGLPYVIRMVCTSNWTEIHVQQSCHTCAPGTPDHGQQRLLLSQLKQELMTTIQGASHTLSNAPTCCETTLVLLPPSYAALES